MSNNIFAVVIKRKRVRQLKERITQLIDQALKESTLQNSLSSAAQSSRRDLTSSEDLTRTLLKLEDCFARLKGYLTC